MTASNPTAVTKKAGRAHPGWLVLIVVLVLVALGHKYCTKRTARAEMEQKAVAQYAAAHPPAPPIVVPAQRPRTPQTLEIPQEGLRVWLKEAPAIYPKLGGIHVDTPSGRSYVDLPGIDHYPGYEPAGYYTFRPEPPGAERKVQIYNRW